ncbi:MAG: hypothetical protein WDN75_00595 [Bacteroidota bacterium]
MKKLVIVAVAVFCWCCGGKLSDEQRKKLHEGMATQDIKRVSESDLQAAAMTYAQSVFTDIEKVDLFLNKKSKIDSIASTRNVKIYSLIPDDKTLRDIEKSLVDAYVTGAAASQVGDNLQRIGEDSLLYTKPVFKDRPDGSQQFSHAVGIKMAKKTIVLSMPNP